MKKVFLVFSLIVVLFFSLFACSKDEANISENHPQSSSEAITTVEAVSKVMTEASAEKPTRTDSETSAVVKTTSEAANDALTEATVTAETEVKVEKGIFMAKAQNMTYIFDGTSRTLYISGRRIVSLKSDNTDKQNKKIQNWEKAAEKVVVKFGTTYIGNGAFSDYESLKHIELPVTLKNVDDNFLSSIDNLEMISFSFPSLYFVVDNGVLFNRNKTQLIKYPAKLEGESYVIPETVTEISRYAFWHADNLKKITLPPDLISVEEPIVWLIACDNLEKIIVPENSKNFSSDAQGVMYNKDMTEIILIPAGVEEFTVPDTVTEFSRNDFAHECSLTKIKLGENCQIQEWYLLHECRLEEIEVSEKSKYYSSVDGILYNKEKTELLWYPQNKTYKKFTVPNTVKTVKDLKNDSLEEVIFSDSVCSVYSSALRSCSNLKKVHFGKNMREIIYDEEFDVNYQNPFANCKNFEKITVASENKHFKVDSQGAFYTYGMTKLITVPAKTNVREFVVPDSVDMILNCFANCNKIEKIHIGSGVEIVAIGESGTESIIGFNGCVSLESISVSKNNKNYTSSNGIMFSKDMKRLYLYPANKAGDTYTVPETVEYINDFAFRENSNLKEIYIDEKTSVSKAAFPLDENYNVCIDVYCAGSKKEWKEY